MTVDSLEEALARAQKEYREARETHNKSPTDLSRHRLQRTEEEIDRIQRLFQIAKVG